MNNREGICTVDAVCAGKGRGEETTGLHGLTQRTLPNGLTIYVKEAHDTPIVAVYFWVRFGSANEPEELGGIAHFLEHMFFKGTKKRGMGEMDRAIKALGGVNNAFTEMEYTAYFVVVPSEHFATAFDILHDAMVDSVFDPEEIEKERQVVVEEIHQRDDSPEELLGTAFVSKIFEGTPYARSVLGTSESLDRIDREAFQQTLHNFYVPNNVTIVVVGDVATDLVFEQVEQTTQGWEPNPSLSERTVPISFVPQTGIRTREMTMDVNQTYWMMGFPNMGLLDPEDLVVLDVASTILGGGASSPLHQRLVEQEGLVTSVSAWVWSLTRAGIFGVEAHFPPQHEKRVEEIVFEEIDRLKRETADTDALERAKTMLVTEFAYANETDSDLGETIGHYATVTTVEEAVTYPGRIRAVTSEAVRRAVARYCDFGAYTSCSVKPNGCGENR
ncbi:MAG: pitrilysin family protein [Candidatus Latescibacterota bacterium]